MAETLATVRSRVRVNLKELGERSTVAGLIAIDNAIADAYLVLGASIPAPRLLTPSAFTIAANSRTFTLPSAAGLQYTGIVEIQLRSDRSYLSKRSRDEIQALYNGDTQTVGTSRPLLFSLYEDSSQVVQGDCWPRSRDAEPCDLYASLSVADIRDAASMDAATIQFGRAAVHAVVLQASSMLVAAMTDEDLRERKLNPKVADTWYKQAQTLAYQEELRRNNAEAVGYIQRWDA